MGWTQPRRVIIPWMETLSKLFGRVTWPTIRGRSLWVVSDYSFDNPASVFDAVGLLLADPDGLGDWNVLRREIRANLLVDRRSMSWKKLNSDSRRQAAFSPFLKAADHINGIAIVLAFHRCSEFRVPTDRLSQFRELWQLSANWKARHFEQMIRIAYCTAMLVAGLSNPGQDVHWVSDQDHAFANDIIEKDTVNVFVKFLNMFLPHKLGQVRYGTTGHGAEPLFQKTWQLCQT